MDVIIVRNRLDSFETMFVVYCWITVHVDVIIGYKYNRFDSFEVILHIAG